MAEVLARGVRFNVQRLGDGPRTVVFVHGLCLDNLSSWYLTAAPALARDCTLVLYDLRGHGLSEQPLDGYTLDDQVLDLDAILESLGLGERAVAIVGNSFGGLVALAFALRFPERVDRIAMVDAHAGAPEFVESIGATLALTGEERDRAIVALFGEWIERHRVGEEIGRDASTMSDLVRRTRARRRRPMEAVAERLVYGTSFVADVKTIQPLTEAELARIRCPVLAVYGERSVLRPEGEKLARVMPGCRLEIVPGVEHFVILHAVEELRGLLREWLVGAPAPVT
jgi:pimeloyl-ACP methyl ester carboxylesterase